MAICLCLFEKQDPVVLLLDAFGRSIDMALAPLDNSCPPPSPPSSPVLAAAAIVGTLTEEADALNFCFFFGVALFFGAAACFCAAASAAGVTATDPLFIIRQGKEHNDKEADE